MKFSNKLILTLLLMAATVHNQTWAKTITEQLFPDDSFIVHSIDDSSWCMNGKTVNRPVAGSAPNVEKNRSILPATAAKRTDAVVSYDLDEYTTDPTVIQHTEEMETSYAKRQSVLKGHTDKLNLDATNNIMHTWAATDANAIIRTSGEAGDAIMPDATGSRLKLAIADCKQASQLLDNWEVPYKGRHILLPSDMRYGLTDGLTGDEIQALMMKGVLVFKDGMLYSIYGMRVHLRGHKNLLSYNNGATPTLLALNNETSTANAAALVWHEDHVCRAKGAIKFGYTQNATGYYGDTIEAAVRLGGKHVYNDKRGVVSIVEAHSA